MFDTLIADADGVYDPAIYNDRLLLGLKGTMSEAELHILKARMLEGRRAKARRGELGKAVPMGYLRRPFGEVVFDPDEQAQATIRLVFDLFERLRTIGKVMLYLVEHDIHLPVRLRGGARKDELEWRRPNRPTLQNLFANPIYAGAYVYGVRQTDRRRQKPGRPGTGRRLLRVEKADVFLPDRVPAYITWDPSTHPGPVAVQPSGMGWGAARRQRSALRRDQLRSLWDTHDGALQQQRPYRALRLHGYEIQLWRSILPIYDRGTIGWAGDTTCVAGPGAGRARNKSRTRSRPQSRACGS